MKLIKGRTLAELLRQRQHPTEELPRWLGVFGQVCQAVAHAHSKGVLHRDLKPDNVMVGQFGEVQVMDWGLAKVLTAGRAGAAPFPPEASVVATVRSGAPEPASQAGVVLGTYAYMAPEQARGETHKLDEHCDVFGLGGILCAILTGQPPFAGDARRKAEGAELAEALARLDG